MIVIYLQFICLFIYYLYIKFFVFNKNQSFKCLIGKTALVTGGNSGIGLHVALVLASKGCRVIIADRNICEDNLQYIIKQTGNPNVILKYLDLSSFKCIRKFAEDINKTEKRLDILINNAGVGFAGGVTEDGLDALLQINHFGPLLLTHLLLDLLKKSKPSTIIFTSSIVAFLTDVDSECLSKPYKASTKLWYDFTPAFRHYMKSKLLASISSKELDLRLKGTGVTCNAVGYSFVTSNFLQDAYESYNQDYNILKNIAQFFFVSLGKTPLEAAESTVYETLDKGLEGVSGKFFMCYKEISLPWTAQDDKLTNEIWLKSENLCQLKPEERLHLITTSAT